MPWSAAKMPIKPYDSMPMNLIYRGMKINPISTCQQVPAKFAVMFVFRECERRWEDSGFSFMEFLREPN
jgi:hypothetical protein